MSTATSHHSHTGTDGTGMDVVDDDDEDGVEGIDDGEENGADDDPSGR